MRHHFVLQKRLSFHETDMAGIAHFSNFFRWMEETEHAFLREIGFPPVAQQGEQFWGWPRVKASCDYRNPLRFDECFDCHLFVKEIKIRSVVYFFRFFKTASDGEPVQIARGEMTSVYASFDASKNLMNAINLDTDFLSRIEEAPAEAMRLNSGEDV